MKDYLKFEIMTEVAWQLGDTNGYIPHAESRWQSVNIGLEIIESGIIDEDSEDIDEIIADWLLTNGF